MPSLLSISKAESPRRRPLTELYGGMVTYAWTKLLLDQNFNLNEFTDVVLDTLTRSQIMKLPYGIQAKTVVAIYLEKLNQHIWGLLNGREIDVDSTPIEYWLAVPAHWREETKLLLMQAAEEAGFKAKPADRIHMVSEAEAATLGVLHTFASRLEVNDGLLDIGTFHISDVEPRLFFEELIAVQSGKCGGAAVDSRFYQLLRSQLGDALQYVPSAQLGPHGKLMTNFHNKIKSGFTGRTPLELHGVVKMDSSI
ncbi:hypothetical protein N8T08_002438 [Aspergillus melleus]|uniref:Uncharacterized protein n=1 Tax=Aspergillus melleus TaxID=138277 RepID=A0ACC3ALY8_9EURO|nr:hypothetical protein N8T08_002438 [Aspergillus melleus]